MIAFLLGVPGKLKTLLDRLTATRAGLLDNLDAAISTRALASTALSNATWTGALASLLNAFVSSNPLLEAPKAGGLTAVGVGTLSLSLSSLSSAQVYWGSLCDSFHSNSAATWSDAVNYTGSGVLEFVLWSSYSGSGTCSIEIIIDGVTCLSYTSAYLSGTWEMRCAVGAAQYYNDGTTFHSFACPGYIPFRTSLQIRTKAISGSTPSINTITKFRKVS